MLRNLFSMNSEIERKIWDPENTKSVWEYDLSYA